MNLMTANISYILSAADRDQQRVRFTLISSTVTTVMFHVNINNAWVQCWCKTLMFSLPTKVWLFLWHFISVNLTYDRGTKHNYSTQMF